MISLYNINLEGAYDGQRRSLEDFQFDLENVLTMSQVVREVSRGAQRGLGELDILAGTKNKTAAEVAEEIVTEAQRISGQKWYCTQCSQQTLPDEPK